MRRGDFLKDLLGKKVDKIYQVDYNNNRHEDNYLLFHFLITSYNFDEFLHIEGDIDGEHIDIGLEEINTLPDRLKEYDLSNYPILWRPFQVKEDEVLGQIISKTINKVEYAIDKPFFIIGGEKIEGRQDVFTAIRLYSEKLFITIFDSGLGLFTTTNHEIAPDFIHTYDWYLIQNEHNQ